MYRRTIVRVTEAGEEIPQRSTHSANNRTSVVYANSVLADNEECERANSSSRQHFAETATTTTVFGPRARSGHVAKLSS
jgi:hypothetical protein